MSRKLKSNRHSIYSLKYHLVVVTKYRHKFITPEILEELEKVFTRLLNDKDCVVLLSKQLENISKIREKNNFKSNIELYLK